MKVEPTSDQPLSVSEQFKTLSFTTRTQRIVQGPSETSKELHERLREQVTLSFQQINQPTKIIAHSWYTFDASKVLGIPDTVAICTSTCKHEPPYQILVGIRKKGWMKELPKQPYQGTKYEYILYPLPRELMLEEKNKIYDLM